MAIEEFTVKEMVSEMRQDIKALHDKVDSVYLQAKLTNGRVNTIEPIVNDHKKSIRNIDIKLASYTGALAILFFIIEVVLPKYLS